MNEQTLDSGIVVVSKSGHEQELRMQIVKLLLERDGPSLPDIPVWVDRLIDYIKNGK